MNLKGKILYIRIVSIILCLVITAGCALGYFSQGKHRQCENEKFNDYLSDFFMENVSSNTLNLHYVLKNPKEYGIDSGNCNIADYPIDYDMASDSLKAGLSQLDSFRYSSLNTVSKMNYDILKYHYDSNLKLLGYRYFEEPLSPSNGIHAQFPILLCEYKFHSMDAIADYLKILKLVDNYFNGIAFYENQKSKAGLFMSEENCQKVIGECRNFIKNPKENILISTFNKRVNEANFLTDTKRNELRRENEKIVSSSVIKSYRNLIKTLSKLKNTGHNDYGLFYHRNGKEYYEELIHSYTGCDDSADDLFKRIAANRSLNLQKCDKLSDTVTLSKINSEIENSFISDSSAESMIKSLRKSIESHFPKDNFTNCKISYVDECLKDSLAPAFYITAPIDDYKDNTIYINDAKEYPPEDYFTTLAHEGYPGHLYQTAMSYKFGNMPFRALLNFPGYTEGWATYTEMMSFSFCNLNEETASYLENNKAATLSLYATLDIGIHYYGWQIEECKKFLSEYGISDIKITEDIFNLIVQTPGNYLKYYVGYLEFLRIRNDCEKKYGAGFDEVKFHKTLLKIGPAPFYVIDKYFDYFYNKA